jgi:hypothetical protein
MTFKNLQDNLIAEVEKILKDIKTTDTDGKEVVGVKGYAHRLPITQSDEDDPAQYFPYFIVRFDTGRTRDDDDCWHVATDIVFGIHDRATSNGHETILVMIQRLVDRFAWDPLLDKKYRADQDIQWAVGEDDTYPFFFGAAAITFSVPKIGRKEADYV